MSAPPGGSDLNSFRDEKRVAHVATRISSGTLSLYTVEQELFVTTPNGSSPSEIASKFVKFCWAPFPGIVIWG